MSSFGLFTENFPPLVGGGIAEWTRGVAESLTMCGHDAVVYAKWKPRLDRSVHDARPFAFRPMWGRDWHRWRFLYALVYGFQFFREHPDGVMVATTWELGEPFPWLKRVFPSARLWVAAHGRDITRVRRPARLRRTLASAELVVAVSSFTRGEILARMAGLKTGHVVFVPNGVDLSRFSPGPKPAELLASLAIPAEARVILTLARVVERKGHDTVIRALPRVLASCPTAHYVVAGPEEPRCGVRLRALVAELGLAERVHFAGFVPDSALADWYRAADVYAMPSRGDGMDSEGFGITFLEAGACGCPVIGSRSGGIPDAIEDGVGGLLIPPDDPDALAGAIIRVLTDSGLARRLVQSARLRIERDLTWDRVCAQIMKASPHHATAM
jgi:phosphatidyl-myo-inositol dimannoside synthase